jgi:general stress protein 26
MTQDENSRWTDPADRRRDPDAVAKVRELLKDARIAMLTTVAADGNLVTRPMATQQVQFDGDAWFFTEADSPKVTEIQADPRMNAAYTEGGNYVSLSGTASVVHDAGKKRELWNSFAGAWFQCEPEDPSVALIKLSADTAEYWDTPGRASSLIAMVKGKLKGERPDVGDNQVVEL